MNAAILIYLPIVLVFAFYLIYRPQQISYLEEVMLKVSTGDLGFSYIAYSRFFKRSRYAHGMPHMILFKYYGGHWLFSAFDNKLYWVYKDFKSIDNKDPEHQCHWNYFRYSYKSILHIMENHPNLREVRENLKPEDYKPIIISDNFDEIKTWLAERDSNKKQ